MYRKILWMFLYCLAFTMSCAQQYDIIPYENEGKWGLINAKKQFVVFAKYDSVGFNDSGYGFIVKNKNKYGLLNPSGEPVFECIYTGIYDTLGYFVIGKGKKWFIYDPRKRVNYPWTDDFLDDKMTTETDTDLNSGTAPFKRNSFTTQKEFYLIRSVNDTSKIRKDLFQSLKEEGVFPREYKESGKTGVIWAKLNIVSYNENAVWAKLVYDSIPPLYDSILVNIAECSRKSPATGNCLDKIRCFVVKKDAKWGIIGENKEVYLKPEWDFIERKTEITSRNSAYSFIQKEGLWGWIDNDRFSMISEPRFTVIKRVPTKLQDMFFYVETSAGKKGYVRVNTGKAYF